MLSESWFRFIGHALGATFTGLSKLTLRCWGKFFDSNSTSRSVFNNANPRSRILRYHMAHMHPKDNACVMRNCTSHILDSTGGIYTQCRCFNSVRFACSERKPFRGIPVGQPMNRRRHTNCKPSFLPLYDLEGKITLLIIVVRCLLAGGSICPDIRSRRWSSVKNPS